MKKLILMIMVATLTYGIYAFEWKGQITDKSSGWKFEPSKPKNGMTYNEFEGYYPDKGGKLFSSKVKLNKKSEEAHYYRITFEAQANERAYQGINFYDKDGKMLPDLYDVVYAGPKQKYSRVFYAMDKVDSVELFFQSISGIKVWNIKVEPVTYKEGAEYCDNVYKTLPPLNFNAPKDAMKLLPKTSAALKSGKPFRVVMLGDSIMQDTFHSQFHSLLKRKYPNSNFKFIISMRGGTGCWLYCQADQYKDYVFDQKPDLLIIGGISNNSPKWIPSGTEAIESVIKATKKHFPDCEILINSATLACDTRKYDKETLQAPVQTWDYAKDSHAKSSFLRDSLPAMAKHQNVPLWDMQTPAYQWLYSTGLPFEFFSRDRVHSGEKGKQLIGRIFIEYLQQAE